MNNDATVKIRFTPIEFRNMPLPELLEMKSLISLPNCTDWFQAVVTYRCIQNLGPIFQTKCLLIKVLYVAV